MLHQHHLYQKAQLGETEAVLFDFLPKTKSTNTLLLQACKTHITQSQQRKEGNGGGLR
jgi:hypothetical protein